MGHSFFGESVFYTKNKTILGYTENGLHYVKFFIREDKYDEYIELLNGAVPPEFYLQVYALRYAADESTSYTKSMVHVDDEFYEVLKAAVYEPVEVMSYSEYSDKGKHIIETGILHGGETDWEFYCSAYPFYYTDEYGLGIAVGKGDDVKLHLISRGYDEMIRDTYYGEDARFNTGNESSTATQ